MAESKILLLPGDGIGPEVCEQAVRVLELFREQNEFPCTIEVALVGGASIDANGTPLTQEVIDKAKAADAVLLGAVGGPKWDSLPSSERPERGLLGLRSQLQLFSNLRPAILYPALAASSSLKAELVENLDILIVRELTGGAYFGEPRGIENIGSERKGFNTCVYTESEIERIMHSGFSMARLRGKKLCSVDKANVLEVSALWREVAERVAKQYPDVELSHMYVDNAAMQLVRQPKMFDVIVTENMFGDILSDLAAMLTGSIGMLPSASLDSNNKGMYEPVHGSAPDIAGKQTANPLATILCIAMMLQYTFNRTDLAEKIYTAVQNVLQQGARTADIARGGEQTILTVEMGNKVIEQLS